jgi:hypothetical protein
VNYDGDKSHFDAPVRCSVALSVACVRRRDRLPSMKEKLWTKDFWAITIISFIIFFVFYVLLTLLPIYILERLHATA